MNTRVDRLRNVYAFLVATATVVKRIEIYMTIPFFVYIGEDFSFCGTGGNHVSGLISSHKIIVDDARCLNFV